ncbi:copper amine oxidase N-terminal domain-containing protein [Bacillus sp. CGMCC 1.16607]|uniref:copper amine oxidase N-terminal domain-containing protein n=1 Tax=Bacillus sp. CGMCC 1.16607 TaxID=3351842 RepID=UPI00362B4284
MKVFVTAALITGLVWSGTSAMAIGQTPINKSEVEMTQPTEQIDSSRFIKFSGVITNINQMKDKLSLVVEDKSTNNTMVFPMTDEVLILNSIKGNGMQKDKLKNGLKVDVYYAKNKPMPLIYPPMITPDIVIVEEEVMGQVKISKFNDDLTSLDATLKLHISKETILEDEKGEKVTENELKGKELIVFYDISTRSIPAQTTPKKIIVLDNPLSIELQQIINEDHYLKNNTKMIPLRKVAEHLGYKVEWQKKTSSVMVSKQNRSFLVTIEKNDYGYNRSLRYFDVAPEIKNGKTYVSEELLDLLNE